MNYSVFKQGYSFENRSAPSVRRWCGFWLKDFLVNWNFANRVRRSEAGWGRQKQRQPRNQIFKSSQVSATDSVMMVLRTLVVRSPSGVVASKSTSQVVLADSAWKSGTFGSSIGVAYHVLERTYISDSCGAKRIADVTNLLRPDS